MGIWRSMAKGDELDWGVRELGPDQARPDLIRHEVEPNTAYLHMRLLAMRLGYGRRWSTTYHCSLSSYLRTVHYGGSHAEFIVTASPADLRGVTKETANRVVMGPLRLAGPVPYRGDDVEVEIGLFSIPAKDLAAPYLDLLESVGRAAGIGFIGPAMSLVGPLKDGVTALVGTGLADLQVGLSRAVHPVCTGVFAALAASPEQLGDRGCVLRDTRLHWADDLTPVTDISYIVYSIETTRERGDWSSLPGLREAYQDLIEAVRRDSVPEVKKRQAHFERVVRTSPDLLVEHATEIVDEVSRQVVVAMPGGGQSQQATDLVPWDHLPVFLSAASESANEDLLSPAAG